MRGSRGEWFATGGSGWRTAQWKSGVTATRHVVVNDARANSWTVRLWSLANAQQRLEYALAGAGKWPEQAHLSQNARGAAFVGMRSRPAYVIGQRGRDR
jgi:hypothetical protein